MKKKGHLLHDFPFVYQLFSNTDSCTEDDLINFEFGFNNNTKPPF